MGFYVRADDYTHQIGPMSLNAAESVVRATAMAQRSSGSRVWGDGRGKLFVKEAGCAPAALWITDERDRLVNIDLKDLITELGTRRQQIFRRIKQRIETAVRRGQLHN
jgi:hypothetical protein